MESFQTGTATLLLAFASNAVTGHAEDDSAA